MKKSLTVRVVLFLTILAPGRMGGAEEPALAIRFVGTEDPSSFPSLLWVHFTNQAFTAANLMEMMASSELLIDGKPSRKVAASFEGPPGIPPQGDWEGCLSLEDFTPKITPGKHRVSLKMGDVQSSEIAVRWFEPVSWRKGTMKTRLKEVHELASLMNKGLLRQCVEQWLIEKDGGMQALHNVRYYLEPSIKVVVPYSKAGGPGNEHEVVGGPVQVYKENQAAD